MSFTHVSASPQLICFTKKTSLSLIYGLFFPSVLVIIGAILNVDASSATFGLSAGFASLIGLLVLADLMFGKLSINFAKVMAIALLMGYSFTSFFTWISVRKLDGGLSAFTGLTMPVLCSGLSVILLSVAGLFLLGESFRHEVFLDMEGLSELPQTRWILLVSFVLIIGAFVHGGLGFMGQLNVDSKVDLLGALGGWLMPPVVALMFAQTKRRGISKGSKRFWSILFVILLALTLPLGRRVFLYTILLAFLADRFNRSTKRTIGAQQAFALVLALCLTYAGSLAFLYLRQATYQYEDTDIRPNLVDLTTGAWALYQNGNLAEMRDALEDNTEDRGFILGFPSDLLYQAQNKTTAHGEDVLNAIEWSVPSVFWPNKATEMPPVEEELANSLYGTDYPDQANSITTAGLVDYGFIGGLLYPSIMTVAITAYLSFVIPRLKPIISTLILFAGFYLMLNVEQDITSYLIFMRNSLLFSLLFYSITSIRPARTKAETWVGDKFLRITSKGGIAG